VNSREDVVECPTCQKPLTVDIEECMKTEDTCDMEYMKNSILNRIKLDKFQSSTKIDALKEEIMMMLQNDSGAKGIVFSQFTSMLDLIGFALHKAGIKTVKLDGRTPMKTREKVIDTFNNDAEARVFLMGLRAGGVALNLTAASHVFLMEPWWNPAMEQQAQARIHRLGQYKPINVTRFLIEGSIDERIFTLQEKKALIFEGTIGRNNEALGKLTEKDLRFLFSNSS